jgi:hypothetical protein
VVGRISQPDVGAVANNEAAILATLVPGNYAAVVRGKNNTTGIAVAEAYNLQ